jgi:hypothetical protein
MKKILIGLFVLIGLIIPFVGHTTVMTVSSCTMNKTQQYADGSILYEVKLILETDGTDQDEFSLSSYCNRDDVISLIEGGQFFDVITDQGTTAPQVYTVTFDSEKGGDLLSVSTTSVSQAQHWGADTDLYYFPPVWDLQIDFGDIGDSGDDVILYLRFLR